MPILKWIGKSKVINHHQEVPFRVLERKYNFDENGRHCEDNGSGEYRYQDVVIESGVPAIIPGDLFNRVQEHMKKDCHVPAMAKAKADL